MEKMDEKGSEKGSGEDDRLPQWAREFARLDELVAAGKLADAVAHSVVAWDALLQAPPPRADQTELLARLTWSFVTVMEAGWRRRDPEDVASVMPLLSYVQ
jgi:hypothetical protein